MQTSVTFKNLDSSDTLKSYVQEKLDRFDRLLDNPAEANVVLSVEKFRHSAEINIIVSPLMKIFPSFLLTSPSTLSSASSSTTFM